MKKAQQNKSVETLKLEREMAECCGTEHYYSNFMLKFNYTDGVRQFCNKAGGGAYWFFDVVNSMFFDRKTAEKMDCDFIVITLKVFENSKAIIEFKDSDGVFYSQDIPYTDCPEGEWKFFFEHGILMWSGEY